MIDSAGFERWVAAALLTGTVVAAGALGQAFAATLHQAAANDQPCAANVRAKLVELGVSPDDVKDIKIYRREARRPVNNRARRELKGYEAGSWRAMARATWSWTSS